MKTKRILLADNDSAARKMLARVLESCGYLPIVASSDSEAITKFCAAPTDLAILDLKGEQGTWNLYDEIRRLNPLVPVIGITAWSDQYAAAMRRGVDALMEKPLDLKALLEVIEQLAKDSEEKGHRHVRDRLGDSATSPQKSGWSGISA